MHPLRNKWVIAAYVSLTASAVQAEGLRGTPVVVYHHPDAVEAAPYWLPLLDGVSGGDLDEAGTSDDKGVAARRRDLLEQPKLYGVRPLEEQLPLSSENVRPGRPALYVMEGLPRPLFIVGMDVVSLNWLATFASHLANISASGLVVQADSKADWYSLRDAARAAGVMLQLFNADTLLEAYPVTSYPALIVSPEMARSVEQEFRR